MIPRSKRQVSWLIASICTVTIFGVATIRLIPVCFAGMIPWWLPITTFISGAALFLLCITQAKRS